MTREEKERICGVQSYLINHLDEGFTTGKLAKKALLGEQKFKEGFYQLFQMHAGEYVHEARMQLGKFLLLNSEYSVKEIAGKCGYSKTRNFSSAYQKFFKKSPSMERR